MTDFPRHIRKSIKDPEKRERYQTWLTHQLGENRYLVWEDLDQIGLKEGFENLIMFKVGKRHLHAWKNLFEIKEKVYQELVAEFMVTFQFDKTIDKLNDDRMIRFNFMGNPHHISLATFARHLELYTEYQVTTPFFLKANTEVKQRDHTAIWQELTGNQFQSNVKATSFLDKHHQVLHNLIACSIRGKRKTKGAVGVKDLQIIKSIIEQEHVNVAYLVADRILTESGYTESEFAYMGAIITKLVRRMGLLTEDVIGNLTPVANRVSKPYDINYMVRVWLLEKDADGQIRWKDGDIIPGVRMRPPRSKSVRFEFDDSTVHRQPRTAVAHEREEGETAAAEAQSPLIPPAREFGWGDPVSSELMYGILGMLNSHYTQDTYLATEFGFPQPTRPTWVCGPRPPNYHTIPLHPFTMMPPNTTIPYTSIPPTSSTRTVHMEIPRARRTRTTPVAEPVFSVHTATPHEPHIPHIGQPSSRAMTRPRPAESATSETSSETDSPQSGFRQDMQVDDQIPVQTDYLPDMTTAAVAPTFSGFTGMLQSNPVPSAELPPYPMHGASLGSYEVADMGLDPNFHLYPIQAPTSGRQRSSSSASVSRRLSSGQHSASRHAPYNSMPPPAHGPPSDQDPSHP